jgi:hypothetical protein
MKKSKTIPETFPAAAKFIAAGITTLFGIEELKGDYSSIPGVGEVMSGKVANALAELSTSETERLAKARENADIAGKLKEANKIKELEIAKTKKKIKKQEPKIALESLKDKFRAKKEDVYEAQKAAYRLGKRG